MKRKPKLPPWFGQPQSSTGPVNATYTYVPLIRCTMPVPCGKCYYCKEHAKGEAK